MPDFAVALTPPAAASGQRANGYYHLYMSSTGEPIREGQLWWKASKGGDGRFYEIVYVIRIYSPPGGDCHAVLVDIIYGGQAQTVRNYRMEYAAADQARFDLTDDDETWALFDGWYDTISANQLVSPRWLIRILDASNILH